MSSSRWTRLAARLAAVALALAALRVAGGVPVAAAASVPAPAVTAPLPACDGAYKDVPTPFRGYADWGRTLVDTIYAVSSTYAPPDLVATGLTGGGFFRALVKPDLAAMAAAAAAAGARLQVRSAYRSYATQRSTFSYWVSVGGLSAALRSSARPGHSEHQLGTAIDFMSYGGAAPWTYADWATTKAGAWLAANAWRYGFVMTYPKGRSPATTCYVYEPWHYRYFGRATAAAIHASGRTSRESLWAGMAGQVDAAFRAPRPGTQTASTAAVTVSWTEAGPIAARSLRAETAAPVGGSCAGSSWTTLWSVKPTVTWYKPAGLVVGRCYRFSVSVSNAIGGTVTSISGTLLIGAAPPSPTSPPRAPAYP